MMNKIFKAAAIEELNKPLEIVDLYHEKPSENQVKIKLISSGLCGAQVNEMTGKKGPDKYLPHLLGHEGLGRVIEVGEDVKKVKADDYVVLHWRPSHGKLGGIVSYDSTNGKRYGAGPVTTFSEFTIVSENRCTKIKKYKSELKLLYPLMGCALSTSYGAVTKETDFQSDKNIVIFGAGGLGLSILFWLQVFGIKEKPIVVDIHDEKSSHVEELGGSFVHVNEISFGDEFDIIFETTGIPSNVNSSLKLAKSQAKILLIGQTALNQEVTFENFYKIYDGISMKPSQGGQFDPDEDLDKVSSLIEENLNSASYLISDVLKLENINHGFNRMKDPDAKRVILDFE